MALTRNRKNEVIEDVTSLLSNSKMTVIANYQGLSVKHLQALRKTAIENGTTIKVVKNRLVKKALKGIDSLKEVDSTKLEGMLLYAFGNSDEVAAAQLLNTFSKNRKELRFVGAISENGKFLSAEEVQTLAELPTKEQLVAQIVAQLLSTLNDTIAALSGDINGILDGILVHT